MADKKISELDAVSTSADTDQIPVVQSGTTKRATLAQLMSAGGVDTLEARWTDTEAVTGDATDRTTRATAVQNAIDAAVANSKAFVFVPHNFLNYDASAVTFDNSVRMVREGQVGDVYDVKAYGAAGDGTTDDTAAIQAASGAAEVDGGTVYIPPVSDRYVFSSLTIAEPIKVVGDGFWNISNAAFGDAQWADPARARGSILESTVTSGDAIHVVGDNSIRCVFEDFMLVGPGSGTSIGMRFGTPTQNVTQLRVAGVMIANFDTGWHYQHVFDSAFPMVMARGCNTGHILGGQSCNQNFFGQVEAQGGGAVGTVGVQIGITASGAAGGNHISALLCQNLDDGLVVENGGNNSIHSGWFESITGLDIELRALDAGDLVRQNSFYGCRSAGGTVRLTTPTGTIEENSFYGSQIDTFEIQSGVVDTTAIANRIVTLTNNGTNSLIVHGGGGAGSPGRVDAGSLRVVSELEIENPDGGHEITARWAGGSSEIYQLAISAGGRRDWAVDGNFSAIALSMKDDGAGNPQIGFFGAAAASQTVDAALGNAANTGDANTDALIEALKDAVVDHGLGSAS